MTRTDSVAGRGVTDLALVVVLALGTTAVLLAPVVPRAIEWLLGVPYLLFVPGYALVAALFPARPGPDNATISRSTQPDWIVRLALALVGSVIVLAVVGVSLGWVGRLSLVPAVLAIDIVVSVGVIVAWYRRRGVAVDARADPVGGGASVASRRPGLSTAQTLALAVSVLALVGAVAFVGATPAPADPYSEVSLLDGDNGALLGANGTVTLESGVENDLTLRIENHQGSETTYRIVGQLQQVTADGTIQETWTVDRDTVTVPDGEYIDVERRIQPPTTGERLRLRYLVYTGSIPENPGVSNADIAVRQWVDVVREPSA